ncbi:hypothetical protein BCR32DRAFT_247964 [Anaeromyces robustus]|uniref:CBM1 domain-containing protein n=1 Tax=Anaeromyces robustus TaxID=1754192 RepID=A0A1Y1WV90_9FUNG|nr:hypothetical protein BCR32DRAFT_247964 [Anaeromyces robustus]|eukprot:ORX77423.1 hypothetical protein BCR32DRAFT_247964 [Anaeromyces robustus]
MKLLSLFLTIFILFSVINAEKTTKPSKTLPIFTSTKSTTNTNTNTTTQVRTPCPPVYTTSCNENQRMTIGIYVSSYKSTSCFAFGPRCIPKTTDYTRKIIPKTTTITTTATITTTTSL